MSAARMRFGIVAHCFDADDRDRLERFRYATANPGAVRVGIAAFSEIAHRRAVEPLHALRSVSLADRPQLHARSRLPSCTRLGRRRLLEAVLAAVCRRRARLAEPGEFTLRAFLAGRIDLTQAEAVLGVIDARGEDDLDASLAQLAGGLARPLNRSARRLVATAGRAGSGPRFRRRGHRFISPAELT